MAVDCRVRPINHKWLGIVIHHTSIGNRNPDTVKISLWKRLFKNIGNYLQKKDNIYVSAHHIIGRFGENRELLDPHRYIAYHAGRSSWWNFKTRKIQKSCNSFMIGIELVGDGNRGCFSELQYEECASLCKRLSEKYSIPLNMIVGHEMVSPGRKNDPGKFFDWYHFFGLMSKF